MILHGLEGSFFGYDERIFGGVYADEMFFAVIQVCIELRRILLEEEDIGIDFGQIFNYCLDFPLLAKEAQLIEGPHLVPIDFGIFIQGLLQICYTKDIFED